MANDEERRKAVEIMIRDGMKELAVDYKGERPFRRAGSYLSEVRHVVPFSNPDWAHSIDFPEEHIFLCLNRIFLPRTLFAIDSEPGDESYRDEFIVVQGLLYDKNLIGLVEEHFGDVEEAAGSPEVLVYIPNCYTK